MAETAGIIVFALWYIAIAMSYALESYNKKKRGTDKQTENDSYEPVMDTSSILDELDYPEDKTLLQMAVEVAEDILEDHVEEASEKPAPEAPAPEAPAPESPAPESLAPESPAPKSPAPESPAPEAPAPEAPDPEPPAPEAPASEPDENNDFMEPDAEDEE